MGMSRDTEDKKAPVSQKVRQDLEPIVGRFVPPLEKKPRESKKQGVDYSGLEKDMRLQVYADGAWYAAKVVLVSEAKNRARAPVKVTFLGYDTTYDEWVGAERMRSKALIKA